MCIQMFAKRKSMFIYCQKDHRGQKLQPIKSSNATFQADSRRIREKNDGEGG